MLPSSSWVLPVKLKKNSILSKFITVCVAAFTAVFGLKQLLSCRHYILFSTLFILVFFSVHRLLHSWNLEGDSQASRASFRKYPLRHILCILISALFVCVPAWQRRATYPFIHGLELWFLLAVSRFQVTHQNLSTIFYWVLYNLRDTDLASLFIVSCFVMLDSHLSEACSVLKRK